MKTKLLKKVRKYFIPLVAKHFHFLDKKEQSHQVRSLIIEYIKKKKNK